MGDVSAAASLGCTEFGYVYPWDGSNTLASYASQIHNAGIPTATFNLFNDGSSAPCQLGAAGSPYAGYFQAIASAGWNCIAGEGCGGDVIATAQNYLPYINYGGDQQNEMYASPWNHPSGGGKGHWDYIETYTAGSPSEVQNVGGVEGCINSAKSHGAGHLGILIGAWASADAGTYQGMIDSCGCDTVCIWAGYNTSAATGSGYSAFQQLISHYGAVKDGKGTATTGGGTAAAKPAEIQCPCRHIWIGVSGTGKSTATQHLEFEVKIVGTAGWVDNNEQWIANKPYTGKLEMWGTNPTGGSWKMGDIWPDKKGNFSFLVGSDTIETRKYAVCFA